MVILVLYSLQYWIIPLLQGFIGDVSVVSDFRPTSRWSYHSKVLASFNCEAPKLWQVLCIS